LTVEKLNNTSMSAKTCEKSLWEVISQYTDLIYKMSERNRNRISSQESFEQECFKQISLTVMAFDNSLGGNVGRFILRRLGRTLQKHRTRFLKRQRGVVIGSMGERVNEHGDKEEIEPIDVLANVEADVLNNEHLQYVHESVTRLASDDTRRLEVLNAWYQGYTSVSEISTLLAQRLGGEVESHRRAVTRFRTRCRKALDGLA